MSVEHTELVESTIAANASEAVAVAVAAEVDASEAVPADETVAVDASETPLEAPAPTRKDDDATAWLGRLGALRSRIDPVEFAYAHTMVVRALREDEDVAQSLLRKVEARLVASAEATVAPYAGAGDEALASFERARQMYEDALTSLKNAHVVADALGQLEVDAGPYNAAHLVTQSLARMSRLSVSYLDAFLERMQLYALLMGDEETTVKPKLAKGREETGTATPPKRGARTTSSSKAKGPKLIKR